jgi:hypothetical protein
MKYFKAMIAFEKHLVSSIPCKNFKRYLTSNKDLVKKCFNQSSIIFMKVENFEK